MKHVLLGILCICTTLSLPAFAQDQPSQTKQELTQAPAFKPWTGDLDGMVKRRVIRALVAPSRTSYWLNGARQTGAEYELLKAFEEEVNNHHKTQGKHIRIIVAFIPTSRDQLIPGLLEGRGDIAAGILTVTPERLEQVDFGEPFFRGVKEIAVTGPGSPELASVDDLSGKEVFVRKSSSFWTHLEHLNERFAKEQKPPVILKAAPEDLQDDDLLEMVHAGLVGIVVVDRYQARLWATRLQEDQTARTRRGQQGRRHRLDDPQEQPETESGDCRVRQAVRPEVGLREGPRQEIHRQPADREARDVGRRDQEVPCDDRVLSQIRRPV